VRRDKHRVVGGFDGRLTHASAEARAPHYVRPAIFNLKGELVQQPNPGVNRTVGRVFSNCQVPDRRVFGEDERVEALVAAARRVKRVLPPAQECLTLNSAVFSAVAKESMNLSNDSRFTLSF
jgi:hypothetical protein